MSAGASDGFEGSDRDYVDGELLERNWGEARHGRTQCLLTGVLAPFEATLGIESLLEIRVRINPHRYRVADLAVWRSAAETGEGIPVVAPFLVVEILSPADRMSRMVPRIRDYFDAGVEWVWLIDTEERIALVYSRQNPLGEAVTVLRTESPIIEIPLEDLLS